MQVSRRPVGIRPQCALKAFKHWLAVLRHVKEVSGSVAATCRYYGISRQCYNLAG
ncbi:hypothetical protein OG735_40160 [Streptomyces sp. NBC_01210]|uniref:hypothetical protein n=1 Tax=Streptomyces sp. NBC_01210 TaxID=2903774 RepID=UPI002E120C42|nr:hypothetical protein OG735_40160 [Streptomyces sp. NBC_01210]